MPLSVEDLVREGEAGRDFKNYLMLGHLQHKVEDRGRKHIFLDVLASLGSMLETESVSE